LTREKNVLNSGKRERTRVRQLPCRGNQYELTKIAKQGRLNYSGKGKKEGANEGGGGKEEEYGWGANDLPIFFSVACCGKETGFRTNATTTKTQSLRS